MVKKQTINKQNLYFISLLVVLALGFLALGIAIGISWQDKKISLKTEKAENILKILNSEVVPSIVSYGIVSSINDREVTMVFNEDPITIKVKNGASIYNVGENGGKNLNQSDFSQIKVGDVLNAKITVDSNGIFESNSIIVFSDKN